MTFTRDINYTPPALSEEAGVAHRLYQSKSVRGAVAALQALPLAFTSYSGDDEFLYGLLIAFQREAGAVLAHIAPLVEGYEAKLESANYPADYSSPIGVASFG